MCAYIYLAQPLKGGSKVLQDLKVSGEEDKGIGEGEYMLSQN